MNWFAVVVGGIIGTSCRYFFGSALQPASLEFPWSTLAINITGSLALGFLGRYFAPPNANQTTLLFFTTGLCGSYTTFSTFALDAFGLVERGAPARAMVYVLASVVGSYVAVVAGYITARSLRPAA